MRSSLSQLLQFLLLEMGEIFISKGKETLNIWLKFDLKNKLVGSIYPCTWIDPKIRELTTFIKKYFSQLP